MKLKVKELCQERGITQKVLSERLGIAEISLSRSINGNPTIGTLEKISTALGVDITELFEHSSSDFTAFINDTGTLHYFANFESLKSYIQRREDNQ